MNKKSQIHMTETVAILLVFFALLVLGFAFYANVTKVIFGREKTETQQLKSIEIAQGIAFLPEIQCNEDIVTEISDCIDILKLEAAKGVIEDNYLYYFDELGYSQISVRKLYPQPEKNWTLYENPLPGYSTKLTTSIPVSLSEPPSTKKDHYYFGILTVYIYLK